MGIQILILCLVLVAPRTSAEPRVHDALERQIALATVELEETPGDEALLIHRSELYRLHEQWNAALADLAAVHALRRSQEFVLVRGRLLRDMQFLRLATIEVDRYLASIPGDSKVRSLRAEIRAMRGQHAGALADLEFVVANLPYPEPDHFVARARAAAACTQLAGEAIPRALAGLDEGIVKLGPVPSLQLAAIDLELSRGDYDEALRRLATISERSGRKERWLLRRGDIFSSAGREREAREAWEAALIAIRGLKPRLRLTPSVQVLERDALARLQAKSKLKNNALGSNHKPPQADR